MNSGTIPDVRAVSLIWPVCFPVRTTKFPAQPSREFLYQAADSNPLSAAGNQRFRPGPVKFPVFSLLNREFQGKKRDGFARDCLLQRRVRCELGLLAKLGGGINFQTSLETRMTLTFRQTRNFCDDQLISRCTSRVVGCDDDLVMRF